MERDDTKTRTIEAGRLARLLGFVASTCTVAVLAVACDGTVVRTDSSTTATVDVYETVDAVTEKRSWKVEIHNPHPDYEGEYLFRSHNLDGDLVEERWVSSWRSLVPGVSSRAAELAADPEFRRRMEQMRRDGLSTAESVNKIADEMVTGVRWEDER